MKKSIFLFLLILAIISINSVEALENKILIGCDQTECSYNLNDNNLPNGISWNDDTNTLTLNNYVGESLYIINDNDITIDLKNNNKIIINDELNYGIKTNNNLLFISNEDGILEIDNSNEDNNINAIITDEDMTFSSGNIYINLKGNNNYKGLVADDLIIKDSSSIFININSTSENNQYGFYNSSSVSIDTTKELKIDFNNSENSYIYLVGPLNYEEENYIGTILETSKKSYFYISYKIQNKINLEEENGSIILNKKEAETGDKISLTIIPNDYYEYSNLRIYNEYNRDVTEEINYNYENNTFSMPPYEITIKIIFTKIMYNITKEALLRGTFDVIEHSTYGEKVKINIFPNEGYEFNKINIKNSFTGTDVTNIVNFNEEDYTFDMPGFDISINILLERKTYKVIKEVNETGSFTINTNNEEEVKVQYLDEVEITDIVPNKDYSSVNYSVYILNKNDEVVNELVNYNKYKESFIMPFYNVKIKIIFNKVGYKIIKEDVTGGKVISKSDANEGEEINLIINPNDDYILKSIKFYDYLHPKIQLNIDLNLDNYTFIMPNKFIIIKPQFIKKPTIPKVKTNLYGYDDVYVSWNKIIDAEGYYIYYRKSTSDSYSYLGKTNNLYYKKTNLVDGVKYYFKVVAYIKDIEGNEYQGYNTSSIYTLKKLNMPTVTKYLSKQVRVKWTKISGVSGYQISRSTKKTGTYVVKTVSNSYSSYKLKTTKNKKYYYKVRAYKIENNKKIYGPWSNVKSHVLK